MRKFCRIGWQWGWVYLAATGLACAQGLQPPGQQQPVHINPGSAPAVPAGVTPQQSPPAAPGAPAPSATAAPAPAPISTTAPTPAAAKPAAGDQPPPGVPQVGLLTSNVNLVLVPVVITDPLDRMVTGLEKDFFTVNEDSVPQTIKTFSSEDAPISVGVVFDSSGSMGDKIQKSREALLQFFKTANPQDEFFLVDFADQPRMLCSFTSNIDQIEDSVTFIQPQGRTALLDAVYLALDEMHQARYARRALLIISDGGDNHSRYTERDVERVVREADVQIYGIGLFSSPYAQSTPEEVAGPALMHKIAEATGGKMFEVSDMDDLPDIATKIGIELRNQYVLGYSPSNRTADGKWRKIQVKLHPPAGLPPLTVSARNGYYGPQP